MLLDASSKKTFLITETNLPNKENLDYFGNGNEAQLIYNFSLPPLILYSMLYGNSTILRKWLMSMPPPMEGTTYFNFIASHDGIGMRPAEGLISEKNIKAILKRMKEFGGEVSYRKVENKSKTYEIIHLDRSLKSLKIAQKRIKNRHFSTKNVKFVLGSILNIDQLNLGLFDYIDCIGVLHHLKSPLEGLKKLYSSLVNGGKYLVYVFKYTY